MQHRTATKGAQRTLRILGILRRDFVLPLCSLWPALLIIVKVAQLELDKVGLVSRLGLTPKTLGIRFQVGPIP